MNRATHALRYALGLLLAVTLIPTAASAQDMDALFSSGAQAYIAGDREAAIHTWERLREAGVRDPDLEFNLATAYGETGHLGRAVWHFETALALRPGDDDASAGLEAARTAIGRRLAQVEGEATVQTRPPMGEAVVAPFSERGLAWTAILLNALFFLVLAARRFARRESLRVGLAIAAPLVALLLVADLWGVGIKRGLFEQGQAGIVLDDAPLSEGPDPRAGARGDAREGERARILDTEGDFVRVRLGGDRHGWITHDHVGSL